MEKKLVLDFDQQQLHLLLMEDGNLSAQNIPFDAKRPFSLEEVKDQIRAALPSADLEHVTWFGPDFTLIPDSIFQETELTTYYELNFGKIPNDRRIQFENVHAVQAVIVFSVPNWILELTTQTLHKKQVHSVLGLLLQKQFSANDSDSVYLLIEDESFVLSVKQQKRLQLCLPAEFHSTADILYFILANQQHMQLSTVNSLHVFNHSTTFDPEEFESLWKQFKDFSAFDTHFYSQAAYQKSILCASSVVS